MKRILMKRILMKRILMKRILLTLAALVVMTASANAQAQRPIKKLEGMWSNPPSTAVGTFCAFVCTDVGIDKLNALLDDPKNDARPFPELQKEAKAQEQAYIHARLTPAALKTFPLDPADDPGFLRCEPWGLARQMIAPH